MGFKGTWKLKCLLKCWAMHFAPVPFKLRWALWKAKKCQFGRVKCNFCERFLCEAQTSSWRFSCVVLTSIFYLLRLPTVTYSLPTAAGLLLCLCFWNATFVEFMIFFRRVASSLWPPSGALRCAMLYKQLAFWDGGVKKLLPEVGMSQRGEGRAFSFPLVVVVLQELHYSQLSAVAARWLM